jgi:non-heme chloroperoxidase
MPFAQVADGTKLYYESWGTGPPFVLVHALSLNCRLWDNQVIALSDRYRTVVYDQRGHGRSDKPDSDYRFETYGRDLSDLLAVLGLKNVTIVGSSLGSWAALACAYRDRESRISRLVLTGASPRLQPDQTWPHCPPAGSFEHFLNALIDDRAKTTYDFYKSLLNREASAQLVDWIVRTSLEMPLCAFLESAKSVVHADIRMILPKIYVPTLVLNGSYDPACPAGAGHYIATTMPFASLFTFENSGHFPQIEQAREFNAELSRFVAEEQA